MDTLSRVRWGWGEGYYLELLQGQILFMCAGEADGGGAGMVKPEVRAPRLC